jgi:hypothetical protein
MAATSRVSGIDNIVMKRVCLSRYTLVRTKANAGIFRQIEATSSVAGAHRRAAVCGASSFKFPRFRPSSTP